MNLTINKLTGYNNDRFNDFLLNFLTFQLKEFFLIRVDIIFDII